jgi:DeoR family transcriptional regulator, fructose operon transcriptional repressor
MNIPRRDQLREYIQNKGEVQLKDLEQLFPDVSSMTIRRDLTFLENKGYLIRTRKGAKSISQIPATQEDVYSRRAQKNMDAKIQIAKKAVELIEAGRAIFIDSGSTTMCLAALLKNDNLSILTTGPNIGMEVLKNNNSSVTLIGGQLSRNNLSTSGSNSLSFIKSINIDIAFMATSGFSLKSGFTSGNFNECELKKAVIKKAHKVILLMDASKVDKNMPFTFATLKEIDILISDKSLPDPVIKAAEKSGVIVY